MRSKKEIGNCKVFFMQPGELEACLQHFKLFCGHDPQKIWFSLILTGDGNWGSSRCRLTWKCKHAGNRRVYLKLLTSSILHPHGNMLPTVVASDGIKGGEMVTGRNKFRKSGSRYATGLCNLAISGLLPTPTSREYRGGRHPDKLKLAGRSPSNSLGDTINHIAGKTCRLNPLFVLEMMGFPPLWATAPFQQEKKMPTI